MLKSLSTGAEDAGMQRKMGANLASAGYLLTREAVASYEQPFSYSGIKGLLPQ